MYVCLCMAITERDAAAAIDGGARTAGQILRACGSARPCGGCTPTLRRILEDDARADRDQVVNIRRYREAQ